MLTSFHSLRNTLSRSVVKRSTGNTSVFKRNMSSHPALGASKIFQSELGPINYREVGPTDGEPLIFVPGAFVNGDTWRNVIPEFSSKYRCFVPELPIGAHTIASNGKVELTPDSLALTIGAFATSLNLKQKPTIIANDTAGALTQILISKQPDIPSRVVLISCDAFKNFPPGAFWMLKYAAVIPGFTWMLQKVVSSPTLRKSPLFLGWLAKKPVPDEIVKAWTKPLLTDVGVQRDIISVCKNLSNKYTLDAAKTFSSFTKPVLIAWASEEKLFPTSDAEKLHKLFPNSKLVYIKDSYTLVQEDQPKELSKHIREFLDQNKV